MGGKQRLAAAGRQAQANRERFPSLRAVDRRADRECRFVHNVESGFRADNASVFEIDPQNIKGCGLIFLERKTVIGISNRKGFV